MPRILVICLLLFGCQSTPEHDQVNEPDNEQTELSRATEEGSDVDVATFAGGCFWCMQPPFDDLDGVESTVVGYTGGTENHPTYEQVAGGRTSHVEAVEIRYDEDVISYEQLLHVFWRSHDPTDSDGQFADRGPHYRPIVFYHDDEQRQIAERTQDELDETGPFDEPVVTEIVAAEPFWVAEEYHQEYYKKNPDHYQGYYEASGRAGFLRETWQ